MAKKEPWDRRSALDELAAACIAGDLAAAQQGWRRLSEAETNASYAKFAAQLIPVLLEQRAAREGRELDVTARMEAAASLEHNLGLVISQAEYEQAEMGRYAARLALAEMALIEMTRTVQAQARRIALLEKEA